MNQQSPSILTSQVEATQLQEKVAFQKQPLLQEEPFLLPRSAWARPVTRLRVLMQVKRLLDRQEAKFEQRPS